MFQLEKIRKVVWVNAYSWSPLTVLSVSFSPISLLGRNKVCASLSVSLRIYTKSGDRGDRLFLAGHELYYLLLSSWEAERQGNKGIDRWICSLWINFLTVNNGSFHSPSRLCVLLRPMHILSPTRAPSLGKTPPTFVMILTYVNPSLWWEFRSWWMTLSLNWRRRHRCVATAVDRCTRNWQTGPRLDNVCTDKVVAWVTQKN